MRRQPNRPWTPALPATAVKTYAISAPLATHFRPATCAEMDCPQYLNGWRTLVDERIELGMAQAYYIRKELGHRFRETRTETGLTAFTFEPGQRCFKSHLHRTRIERPEIFLVREGDWRGNPRGTETRRHASPADWQDDFAQHQQTLANRLKEG